MSEMHWWDISQLRDFPTTLKVLVIQVTSMQSERRWKNVKQWISLCWANKFIQYVEENNLVLETCCRCCRRRCADHSPCGDGEWGCEVGRFMKLILLSFVIYSLHRPFSVIISSWQLNHKLIMKFHFFSPRGTGSAKLEWSVSCILGKSSDNVSTLTSARRVFCT